MVEKSDLAQIELILIMTIIYYTSYISQFQLFKTKPQITKNSQHFRTGIAEYMETNRSYSATPLPIPIMKGSDSNFLTVARSFGSFFRQRLKKFRS